MKKVEKGVLIYLKDGILKVDKVIGTDQIEKIRMGEDERSRINQAVLVVPDYKEVCALTYNC